MKSHSTTSSTDGFNLSRPTVRKLKIAISAIIVFICLAGVFFVLGVGRAKGHIQTLYNADHALKQSDTGTLQYVQTLEARIATLEHALSITPPIYGSVQREITPQDIERLKDYLNYSDEDMDQVDDSFLTPPIPLPSPRQVEWKRDLSQSFQALRTQSDEDKQPVFDSATNAPVQTRQALNEPILTLARTDTQHPVFTISGAPKGAQLYLEIDSSENFNSRNLVRYPSLAPLFTQVDNMHRQDQTLQLFQARASGWPSAEEGFVLPFRISAFALDFGHSPSFKDFAHYAQLLAYGLSTDEIIAEVIEVVSRRTDHGGATFNLSAYETFVSGVDECGHVNELFGAILEMNGIRYRGVGGFNPWVNAILPSAGHSAIEIENAKGQWEYADAYLYYHTPMVGSAELSSHSGVGPSVFATPEQIIGKMGLDEDVNVSDLFKYRTYFDKAGRQISAPVSQLLETEDNYGRNFALRSLRVTEWFDYKRDLPRTKTIYARARYVISSICDVKLGEGCSDLDAVASPWVTTQFTIHPQKLLDLATPK